MKIKNFKNSQLDCEKSVNQFKNSINEEINNKESDYNYFIYGEKNDCMNEEFLFKDKEINDPLHLDKHKNSIDLNLSEKNLHEFLNDDLIKALDNDFVELEENLDLSDSNSSNDNDNNICDSECTTKANSPELNIRLPKTNKNIDMNLNIENSFNKKNSNDINKNSSENNEIIKNDITDENDKNNNEAIKKDDKIDNNIKDKIKMLNNPLFAPMFIPKKYNNIEQLKKKEENNYEIENVENKKEKKNNPLKNKFDDDVEPLYMLSMANKEEKTKLPLEIRVGDWICLYCNNLNFSFRIKCNRCGLLRKSSSHLLKQKYYSNKYQYMGNYNNYNDGYFMNYNQNGNYDTNYIFYDNNLD